jgi:hypothetical protein
MYAKSDMFPKNTVVLIENLETGIKVRAVVTGSSGISGLVAVLSPETAAALNIRSGSVSRVRISIPSVVSEKTATGVAGTEAAPASADPDVNPAAAVAGAAPIPLESIANAQENPLVPLDADKSTATPDAAATAPQPNAAASETVAPIEPVAAAEPVATPNAPEAVSENAEPAENVASAAVAAPVAVAPVSGTAGSETAENENNETPAEAESAETASAEPEALAQTEDQTAASPAFYDEPELAVTEIPAKGEESLPVESDSVALVPTEPNPPARSPALDAAAASAASAPVVAPAPVAASAPVAAAPVAPVSNVAVSGALAALPCVSSLAKGSYYIQIASYSDPVRAKKVVDGYAPKYPIVVEQGNTVRGSVLKVCIGPVKKDEYGAILERFKSLGFKDAFVRKGE